MGALEEASGVLRLRERDGRRQEILILPTERLIVIAATLTEQRAQLLKRLKGF